MVNTKGTHSFGERSMIDMAAHCFVSTVVESFIGLDKATLECREESHVTSACVDISSSCQQEQVRRKMIPTDAEVN